MKLPGFVSAFLNLFTRGNGTEPGSSNESAIPVVEPKAEQPKPPLNFDWRLPEADERKLELIGSPWGETVDTYLWYELGELNHLTKEEIAAIANKFFVNGIEDGERFGNIELHHSSVIPGIVLRLRGKVRRLPSFELRGRHCSLYQIGHSGGFCEAPTPDSINFHNVWNEDKEVVTGPVPAT